VIKLREDDLARVRADAGLTTTSALARAMRMHRAAVGRALDGDRGIGGDFLTGLARAFPTTDVKTLFEIVDDEKAA
jgi:plasmid maintenance system antidote protein VapI